MTPELSQSLIDEFNLVKIYHDTENGYPPEYGFSDFVPNSGHLLWLNDDGSFGMAREIKMYSDDTFWWRYIGSITLTTETKVRNQLYHLRASIKKRIKEGKERIAQRKLNKIEMDFI